MRIKYCLLAKSIPEYSKRDQSIYTCSIGYSAQLGLIRVYPLPPSGMQKWGIYEINVERNKRDTRAESWKLSSYSRKNGWIGFGRDVKKIGDSNPVTMSRYLKPYIAPSISKLNDLRKSIGIIKADKFNLSWAANERYLNSRQIGLFSDVEIADFTRFTKESKPKQSRIVFDDEDGRHNLQYNEWGVYEYQRKFVASSEAFRHLKPSTESCILVGNMNSYRNNWIALGVFNIATQLVLL